MTRSDGRTVQIKAMPRRDPMSVKGGKVPTGSSVGTIHPPTGGSKPPSNPTGSGQSGSN